MKLGVMPVLGGPGAADPTMVADLVVRLEELGCESLWAVEHAVIPAGYDSTYPYDDSGKMSLGPDDDVPDPLEWLTFAAAHSRTLLLGTAMLILPQHNPVILAKRLATVDALSGGRLLVGVGVGWLREEYEALGVPFAGRGARADEYLAAMQALWTQSPASFHGDLVRFFDVHLRPAPVRATGIPIVVGGHSTAAVRRAARFGSGLYPLGVDVAGMAGLLEQLTVQCSVIGRDPAEIEVTARAPSTRADAQALADLGVSRVVMRVYPRDLDRVTADVTRFQSEILV
jgi:probable F420-dependent oxidoreductase